MHLSIQATQGIRFMALKPFSTTLLVSLLVSPLAIAEKADLLSIYKLALENDAQFASAREQFNASQEADDQGLAGLLPQINLSASTSNSKSVQLQNGISGRTGGGNTHGWGATLQQPIFQLSSWFNYTKSKKVVSQAEKQLSLETQSLILRVAEAYFNALRAEDSLETAKARETAFKRQYEQAQQRFEVGLIAKTDVLEAKAVYDNARVTRITAENDVEVSYEAIRTITNQLPGDLGKLDKNMPVKAPTPAKIESWVKTALKSNLAVQVANEAAKVAEEEVKRQKAGHAPTVNAKAEYGHLAQPSTRSAFTDSNGKTNTTTYSLNFNFPIYSGGLTSSQSREASSLLAKAMHDKDFQVRTTYQQTRNFFNTVNSDVQRVDARWQSTISSASALEATESGYEVGTRNIIDVLEAQSNLYNSQQDYLNARYDFIINTLKLKQQAGTLSPDDLTELNKWISKSDDTELLPAIKDSEKL